MEESGKIRLICSLQINSPELFTDHHKNPHLSNIGLPLVECQCIIPKLKLTTASRADKTDVDHLQIQRSYLNVTATLQPWACYTEQNQSISSEIIWLKLEFQVEH